jgi:hypothetical protein
MMTVDEPRTVEDELDNAADESFPASDPPSWSSGKKHQPKFSPERDESTDERDRNDDHAVEHAVPQP